MVSRKTSSVFLVQEHVNRMFEVVCEVGNGVLRDKDCQSPVV